MSADRTRSILVLTGALLAAVALTAANSRGEPVLPPPAPQTGNQPLAVPPAPNGVGAQQPDGDDRHDVLTRGPIHEAFAEQYNSDPVAGLLIPNPPPEPIDEVPPETMPEGNNIQWVPGYWGWDDERTDFIWISGLWRDIPPGQRWVPGYWNQTDNGYQWVSGFWTGADSAELDYLPQPPQSLEQGPNIEAPSDNQFWVPGTWNYVNTDYRWRPGYWAPAYDDWVWVPDRYIWTPYGFVFCHGYYDYRLPVRAVAFAPIYFAHAHWWHHHHRPFCPSVVLDVGPLTMHWFVRPNYCHYYFGDYYANSYYTGWGLQPWYTCQFGYNGFGGGWSGRHCHYDPLLVFYAGYHRRHHHIDFHDRMHRWHDHYRDHADERPRHTAHEQDVFLAQLDGDGRRRDSARHVKIGRTLEDFAANPAEHDQKFVKLDDRQRDRHTKHARETVELAVLRHDAESDGGHHGDGDRHGDGGRRGRDGNGDTIALPGATDGNPPTAGEGNVRGDGRRARKFKLPDNQGAGDQTVINESVDGGANRRARRTKIPDGPPGGDNAVSGDGNGGSDNRTPRRGRGSELSGDTSGQNGNEGDGSRGRRGRRGSQGEQSQGEQSQGDSPAVIGGGDTENSGTGGAIVEPRGSSRNRGRGNKGEADGSGNGGGNNGNPTFDQPLGENPPTAGGGGDSGNSINGKGSNRGRSRRGSSGGGSGGGSEGGTSGGVPEIKTQPSQDGQGGGGSSGGDSGRGRSRSRGNNSGGNNGSNGGSSGTPFNFDSNGGASSGSGSGNGSSGSGSGGGRSRGRGSNGGKNNNGGSGSFDFNPNGGGSSGGGSGGGNGSNGGNSGGGRSRGRDGGSSGSFGSGGGNDGGGSGSGGGGSGGSARNRNSGGSGGSGSSGGGSGDGSGGGGRGKKKSRD